jgi:hypothetical protein
VRTALAIFDRVLIVLVFGFPIFIVGQSHPIIW